MHDKFARFLYIFKQYSFGEGVLLSLALILDYLAHRIPSYLVNTKNSLDKFYRRDFSANREGKYNIVRHKNFCLSLRRDSSDFLVVDQVLVEEGLWPIVALAKQNNISIKRILDCGANIGLTSLYLAEQFPDAQILALEPEPENFSQLLTNLNLNKGRNIRALQVGVWYRRALLEQDINFCPAKGWAFALREPASSRGSIQVDTISEILSAQELLPVDYIKMDIEGSEFDLFRNLDTWRSTLDQVKILSVEVHEKKGKPLEIQKILESQGFELESAGELLIGWRRI